MEGIIPPIVTLFDKNGEIDSSLNKKMIDHIIDGGVHGILLLGSSGEFPFLSLKEKKSYIAEMISHINNRVPVMCGVGGTVLKEIIQLAVHATDLGAKGVMVVNHYYWNMTNEQMIEFYSEISKSVPNDIYLYNIPQLTGQEIPIEVIKELVERFSNIKGIKETVPNIGRIRSVIEQISNNYSGFNVYCAFDEHILDTQILGAAGSINGTSVFLPEISVQLYNAIQKKDFSKIEVLHLKISKLMDIYSWHPSFFLTMKEAVHLRWFPDREVGYRKPFFDSNDLVKNRMKELLQNILEAEEIR